MNQVKTVRTPIDKQREFRQERKAIEAENETLPEYVKRNMDCWFWPWVNTFRLIKQSMV
jgi:hypothetical protein